MRIRKNDTVRVISGNARGREGKVLKVYPEDKRIIVEKVNLIKRHTRQTSQADQGGIIEKEAPIDISNVMLICPKCTEPIRVGRKVLQDGRRVRVCRKCGETLDQ